MSRSHAVQSVHDILGIVESAQQLGRRLRVDHDRVVMAPKRLGNSSASWLPGGAGAAPARLADAKVARAVRETILRRIDDGLLGLGQAAGGPAQRAASTTVIWTPSTSAPSRSVWPLRWPTAA